jgi:hypothetical protein
MWDIRNDKKPVNVVSGLYNNNGYSVYYAWVTRFLTLACYGNSDSHRLLRYTRFEHYYGAVHEG